MSGISLTNNNGGITPVNPDIEFIEGNDGIPVPPNPTTHIILLLGDNSQGVDLSGNAVTYTETITMFDATESQKGVVLLASNAEALAGSDTTKAMTPDDVQVKVGAQTLHGLAYGAGNTAAIAWLGEASDGQIPIGQTGGVPLLANVTSLNGTVTIVNGPGSIDLSVSNETVDTATTTGATTADLLTIPLGGTPGTFQFEARVKAFEATTPAGAGYNIYATYRTDGAVATLIGQQPVFNEDTALVDADAYFTTDGSNNAILQVLGVALLTINWSGEAEET